MKQHEIEALRELVKKFRRDGAFLYAKTERYSGVEVNSCARQLEHLLDTFSAPDDGQTENIILHDAIHGMLAVWRKLGGETENKESDVYKMLQECIGEVEDILALIPDPWKPIADAPRKGEEFLAININTDDCAFIRRIKNKRHPWWAKTGNIFFSEHSFTHYREKPVPPRIHATLPNNSATLRCWN